MIGPRELAELQRAKACTTPSSTCTTAGISIVCVEPSGQENSAGVTRLTPSIVTVRPRGKVSITMVASSSP